MNLIPDLAWNIVALHIRDLLFAYILTLRIISSAKGIVDIDGDKQR